MGNYSNYKLNTLLSRLESTMLKYCIIILFWSSCMLLLLFPCTSCYILCSNYAHCIMVKAPQTRTGTNFSPPLSILTAVISGQNVTVLMLVAV